MRGKCVSDKNMKLPEAATAIHCDRIDTVRSAPLQSRHRNRGAKFIDIAGEMIILRITIGSAGRPAIPDMVTP